MSGSLSTAATPLCTAPRAASRPSLSRKTLLGSGSAGGVVRTASRTHRRHPAAAATEVAPAELTETEPASDGDVVVKVQSAEGVRLRRGESEFQLEYMLRIEDPDVNIWVPADSVADDVKQEYEASWWQCCRQGDVEKVTSMLQGGGQALVAARDDDDRSALHYACGVGSEECVRAILSYGAEVDAKDKDCFTPLHIAAGYLHEKVVEILVKSGANPELQDSTGRSPLDLVETLKLNTPATTVTFARRSVLESIVKTLEQFVFEEVPPAVIVACRTTESDQKEYLVQWLDEFSDSWVYGRDISDDLIEDFERGFEYVQMSKTYAPPSSAPVGAKAKSKSKTKAKSNAGSRRYLVKWTDDATPSWETREK